ncbi:M28 family peptidase [Sphingomonas astaxanthinifaciens]|uniref:Peptidase M28 n=1 Tax=Sphingomonas astaxanthinifaciens DSM 22298 TaxID=1123267 RepID=A0ABQ5Z5G9_9SPHN|nr:M28 family peptidase [Sphingomonas astaxanthinifaciens]GLR48028.1 peptidase M28 [Sphingomonas astaxanthinifaciens DSM 22298]
MRVLLLSTALIAAPAAAAAAPATPEQQMQAAAREVSQARIRADIATLVAFGTRHTLSSQTDPKRGIGAAVRWAEAELKKNGLEVAQVCDTVTKPPRVPVPTRVCNAVAIQRGTERPNDVVIITGHIDSRVSDVMNATADAPGANDDGSGTAAVLESARVLSKRKFPGTIVYAALSGEEQGLLGGKILADYAKAQGWNVIANLNNDIIGNSCGSDGVCDGKTVRVFSEGPRWQGREELAAAQRSLGGENDSPSRNISRFLDRLAERLPSIGLDVRQVWRNDRFGRGGDHTEFLNAGFPAIRFSVAVENYDQQHQDLRTEKGRVYGDTLGVMDLPYLTKVIRLNTAALMALASAPPPPEPKAEGAVSTDTTISWRFVPGAAQHVVRWRRTDSNQWQQMLSVPVRRRLGSDTVATLCTQANPEPCSVILPKVRVDDWVFGVSSVSKDGWESPVASAVPGGAFKPYVAPANLAK